MTTKIDLNIINQFLAVDNHRHQHYDVILVLGNAIPGVALKAYELYQKGYADHFMIAGGKGHTTDLLIQQTACLKDADNRMNHSEAAILKEMIEDRYGRDDFILLEEKSTNCGENIQFAFDALQANQLDVHTVLLCHDPLMQRRIEATAKKQYPQILFHNYSAFTPEVTETEDGIMLKDMIWGQWPFSRYISLLLGEMKRVIDDENGYGPRGARYIEHVDVPDEVMQAYQRLMSIYGDCLRH